MSMVVNKLLYRIVLKIRDEIHGTRTRTYFDEYTDELDGLN